MSDNAYRLPGIDAHQSFLWSMPVGTGFFWTPSTHGCQVGSLRIAGARSVLPLTEDASIGILFSTNLGFRHILTIGINDGRKSFPPFFDFDRNNDCVYRSREITGDLIFQMLCKPTRHDVYPFIEFSCRLKLNDESADQSRIIRHSFHRRFIPEQSPCNCELAVSLLQRTNELLGTSAAGIKGSWLRNLRFFMEIEWTLRHWTAHSFCEANLFDDRLQLLLFSFLPDHEKQTQKRIRLKDIWNYRLPGHLFELSGTLAGLISERRGTFLQEFDCLLFRETMRRFYGPERMDGSYEPSHAHGVGIVHYTGDPPILQPYVDMHATDKQGYPLISTNVDVPHCRPLVFNSAGSFVRYGTSPGFLKPRAVQNDMPFGEGMHMFRHVVSDQPAFVLYPHANTAADEPT